MKEIFSRLAVASIAFFGWIGFANAASVQLSGTGFPAPGDTTSFNSGGTSGDAGGAIVALTPNDPLRYVYLNLATDPGENIFTTSGEGFYRTSFVPILPTVWLFGSGLLGLAAIARRKQV